MSLISWIQELFTPKVPELNAKEAYNLTLIGAKTKSIEASLLRDVFYSVNDAAHFGQKKHLLIDNLSKYPDSTVKYLRTMLLNKGYLIEYETEDVMLVCWDMRKIEKKEESL